MVLGHFHKGQKVEPVLGTWDQRKTTVLAKEQGPNHEDDLKIKNFRPTWESETTHFQILGAF